MPGDDDLDIGMLREDYDRFFEIAQSQLKKEFSISDYRIEEKYGLLYMKIRLIGTVFNEESNAEGIS